MQATITDCPSRGPMKLTASAEPVEAGTAWPNPDIASEPDAGELPEGDAPAAQESTIGGELAVVTLTKRDLFVIFLKAGLAFGGGLGIMAALENELVRKRRAVSQEDYLAMYSIGRLVPSGTMTAVAVAYGYRFGGWSGTVVAMTALVLPSTLLTVLLTGVYGLLHEGPLLALLSKTLLPGALALIAATALKFAKVAAQSRLDLAIAVTAFVATFGFQWHPSLVLLAGGTASLFVRRRP